MDGMRDFFNQVMANANEVSKAQEITLAHKTAQMGRLLHRYVMIKHHGAFAGDPLRGQGRVLALLKAKPVTTQRELSFVLDMRQQSLSELLAKLEAKGYITRSKSADDARVTVIELTPEGLAAAPNLENLLEQDDPLDCLSAEDKAQFETYVDTITASLKEKLVALGDDPNQPHRPHGFHGKHGKPFPPHWMGEPQDPRCEDGKPGPCEPPMPFPHEDRRNMKLM
ncbi:MAG: winged helix-turn-helix transcriptional regulator [Coriobacteriales bacterium]|nr:winged helix-turn-helix transcriptional regulator [Coriobacteriales bacterium]